MSRSSPEVGLLNRPAACGVLRRCSCHRFATGLKPNSRLIPALYSSSLDPAILTISSSVLPARHFMNGPASGPTG